MQSIFEFIQKKRTSHFNAGNTILSEFVNSTNYPHNSSTIIEGSIGKMVWGAAKRGVYFMANLSTKAKHSLFGDNRIPTYFSVHDDGNVYVNSFIGGINLNNFVDLNKKEHEFMRDIVKYIENYDKLIEDTLQYNGLNQKIGHIDKNDKFIPIK